MEEKKTERLRELDWNEQGEITKCKKRSVENRIEKQWHDTKGKK